MPASSCTDGEPDAGKLGNGVAEIRRTGKISWLPDINVVKLVGSTSVSGRQLSISKICLWQLRPQVRLQGSALLNDAGKSAWCTSATMTHCLMEFQSSFSYFT